MVYSTLLLLAAPPLSAWLALQQPIELPISRRPGNLAAWSSSCLPNRLTIQHIPAIWAHIPTSLNYYDKLAAAKSSKGIGNSGLNLLVQVPQKRGKRFATSWAPNTILYFFCFINSLAHIFLYLWSFLSKLKWWEAFKSIFECSYHFHTAGPLRRKDN
jgi:hypothetical protein